MYKYESHDATAIIVCASIAGFAVVLRLIARKRAQLRYGWEDIFSAAASLSFFSAMGVSIWGYGQGGWGRDINTLSPETVKVYYKAIYVGPPLIVVAINFAKMSILCLLYRIFGVTRQFRIKMHILTAYVLLVSIGTFFGLLLQCSPVSAGWDITARGDGAKCIDPTTAARAAAVLDATSELLMCLLPISVIRKLELPPRRRVGLSVMFALGFTTAILAVVRATTATWPGAENADLTIEVLWVSIQICVGIVVGCMPTYRMLLPENLGLVSAYFRRNPSISNALTKFSSRRKGPSATLEADDTDYKPISKQDASRQSSAKGKNLVSCVYELDPRSGETISTARASDSRQSDDRAERSSGDGPPLGRIQVERTFSVV